MGEQSSLASNALEIIDDVLIEDVTGTLHRSNKHTLASRSEYFKLLFQYQPDLPKYKLNNISTKVTTSILRWVETDQIELRNDNIEEMIISADFLALDTLVHICVKFLMSKINPENGIGFWTFSKSFLADPLEVGSALHLVSSECLSVCLSTVN